MQNIMHRDLKPANILFCDGKSNGIFFKLCDFGLAKFLNDDKTHTAHLGTQNYMAPEVFSGKYDKQCDIYSLCIIGKDLFDKRLKR